LPFDTGCRLAEVTNLPWSHDDEGENNVDLDQGVIIVLGRGAGSVLAP
jgi:hypothetical protein